MAERAQLRVEHLYIHAVTIHVPQAGLGVEVAGAPRAFQVEVVQRQCLPPTLLLCLGPLYSQRVFVERYEALGEAFLHVPRSHQHV